MNAIQQLQSETTMSAPLKTNNLIPVFSGDIAGQPAQLVDARELHSFLEVARDFSNWIKDRIEAYGFLLDQDYLEFSPKLAKTSKGGRPTKNYHLTLDTAKELSMVERNEKGREARRYFIDCERRMLRQTQNAVPLPTQASQPSALAALSRQRYFLSIEGNQLANLTPIAEGTLVMNPDNPAAWTSLIAELAPRELIPHILKNAADRMLVIAKTAAITEAGGFKGAVQREPWPVRRPEQHAELLYAWYERFGDESLTVGEVIRLIDMEKEKQKNIALVQVMQDMCGNRKQLNPNKLGIKIRQSLGYIVDGLQFVIDGEKDRAKKWRVVAAAEAR
jgi:phage anti-repressor protein